MVLRQLIYLVAPARERHFARAAACHVAQPTLSPAIRQRKDALAGHHELRIETTRLGDLRAGARVDDAAE